MRFCADRRFPEFRAGNGGVFAAQAAGEPSRSGGFRVERIYGASQRDNRAPGQLGGPAVRK